MIQMAAIAGKQAGNVNKLSRHSKLDVANGPSLPGTLSQLVRKIDRHGPPVAGKIVLEEARYPILGTSPKSAILEQVAIQNTADDSTIRVLAPDTGGFQQKQQAPGGISIGESGRG